VSHCYDGSVWTWGDEEVDGNRNDTGFTKKDTDLWAAYRYNPTKVKSLSNIVDIAAGHGVYAIKNDGTLWGWGSGLANPNPKPGGSFPVQFNISDVKSVYSPHIYSPSFTMYDSLPELLAVKNDGTLWYWYNNMKYYDEPIQVQGISNVETVVYTYYGLIKQEEYQLGYTAYIIDKNNNVWRWGDNDYGQLGNDTYYSIDSPEQMFHPCVGVDCDTIIKNPDLLKLDSFVYSGSMVNLALSQSDAELYWWYPQNKVPNCKFCQNINIQMPVTDSIEYTGVIMDTYGCQRKERFMLRKKCDSTLFYNPKLIIDTLVMANSRLILKPSPYEASYTWGYNPSLSCNDCQNPVFRVLDSAIIVVSIMDTFDCPLKGKFIINKKCDSTKFYNPTQLLDTVVIPNSTLNLTATNSIKYSWSPVNGLNCSNCKETQATINESIEYIASITDSFKCVTKEKFIIRLRNCDTIEPKDTVVKMDTVIYYPAEVSLNTSKSTNNYQWVPSTGLSCNNCQSPSVLINKSVLYIVDLSDQWQCPYKEAFNIKLIKGDIIVPNVFTPNNDNINDYLEISGIVPSSSLKIFDNQGQVVYSSDDYQNNWNGKDGSGKNLADGTYWYILNVPNYGIYKGWVYLKR
jgi:gliding motility-associated-like protein